MKQNSVDVLTKEELGNKGINCTQLLERLVEIDWDNFNDLTLESEGSIEQWAAVFNATSDLWRVLAKDGKIIAYWNCIVFKDEYQRRMEEGDLLESDMHVDTLKTNLHKGQNEIYFDSICIDKPYRTVKIMILLLKSVYETLSGLIGKGVKFNKIWASGWTEEGEKLLNRLGFIFYKDNKLRGKICYLPFDVFMKKVGSIAGKLHLAK